MKTTRPWLSQTLTSEDWGQVRDQAIAYQGTMLARLIAEKFERATALEHRNLLNKNSTEPDMRYAQGFISALRYATIVVDEIIKESVAQRKGEDA